MYIYKLFSLLKLKEKQRKQFMVRCGTEWKLIFIVKKLSEYAFLWGKKFAVSDNENRTSLFDYYLRKISLRDIKMHLEQYFASRCQEFWEWYQNSRGNWFD